MDLVPLAAMLLSDAGLHVATGLGLYGDWMGQGTGCATVPFGGFALAERRYRLAAEGLEGVGAGWGSHQAL